MLFTLRGKLFSLWLICGTKLLKKGSLPTLHLSVTKDFCVKGENITEDHNYSMISTEPHAFVESETSIAPSSPDETCASTAAIERLRDPIEDVIQNQDCVEDTPKDKPAICKSLPEVQNLQELLNQRNSEILILNRRVQRLQRNALTLKATNKNLRSKLRQVEKEAKILRVSLIRARKRNETKRSKLFKQ